MAPGLRPAPPSSEVKEFGQRLRRRKTRLGVNGTKIDQKAATKILGCWIDEDAGSWSTNTRELVKAAYSRISMLSNLKYTGVRFEDLLDIYKLFIRSRAEYLSVAWHSSLTAAQSHKIENIQKTSFKIILAEGYVDYLSSCQLTGLQMLSDRRKSRCLAFAKRCLLNPQTKDMFPLNAQGPLNIRNTEKYIVNFARTENYKNSAVPYCQRLLNEDYRRTEDRARRGSKRGLQLLDRGGGRTSLGQEGGLLNQ